MIGDYAYALWLARRSHQFMLRSQATGWPRMARDSEINTWLILLKHHAGMRL
jgi:hypothetical protein